jgi:hypothetical protein
MTTLPVTIPANLLAPLQRDAKRQNASVKAIILEVLAERFASIATHPRHDQIHQEVIAFHNFHPRLSLTHLGEFVAIKNSQVVDHGPDFDIIVERVQARFSVNDVVIMEQVLPTFLPDIQIRSPRLVYTVPFILISIPGHLLTRIEVVCQRSD